MEQAREWLERKQGPLVERDEIESIASLIQEVRNETLEAVVAHMQNTLVSIEGCGDSSCLIQRPNGMCTNGGCRCWQDKYKAQRFMALTQSAIRSLKSQTQHSKEGEGK